MVNESSEKTPSEIKLHQKSRVLEITFSDGKHFALPCEYLRVHSRAAEERVLPGPVIGKEDVNISQIEPLGHYAIRIYFDDGHNTGIYSWDTLYDLGVNQQKYWQDYLTRLAEAGYRRKALEQQQEILIKILYFAHLVKAFGREAEEVELPETVHNVGNLLHWLQKRGERWERLLAEEEVRVTINKQFAELSTALNAQDEVALVPTTPRPV
jgi:DUF971 family protein/molybdopterin converting factor small subunit